MPDNLHIAVSQRIVGRHLNSSRLTLDATRDQIDHCARVADTPAESKDMVRLREHLERVTGISIAELAEITKRWPT